MFLRGRIIETNCVLENTPPPLFGQDVVYRIGGRINGTLQYLPIPVRSFSLCRMCCSRILNFSVHLSDTLRMYFHLGNPSSLKAAKQLESRELRTCTCVHYHNLSAFLSICTLFRVTNFHVKWHLRNILTTKIT